MPEESVGEAADGLAQAIRDSYVMPFEVRTGPVGCFWAAAGTGWGRIPRVVYQGVMEEDMRPLLRLHGALEEATADATVKGTPRPFCAHITVAKTMRREVMNANDRRALRVFAKWLQDPGRPMGLQRALEPRLVPPPEGSRRGWRRFRNWYGRASEDVGSAGWDSKPRRVLQRYLDWGEGEEEGSGGWEEEEWRSGGGGRVVKVDRLCVVRSRRRTDGVRGTVYDVLKEVPLGLTADS